MSASLRASRIWMTTLVIVAVYTGLNAAAVFLPFIPSLETLIAWACLFPLLTGFLIWSWLASSRHTFPGWWTLGLWLSFWLLCLSVLSYMSITEMWAAV